MFLLKKLLHVILLPPGLFVFPIIVGLLLVRRTRRAGLLLAWSGTLALVVFSIPIVADGFSRSLETAPLYKGPQGAQAIVILGGGMRRKPPEFGERDTVDRTTLERLRYGARLHRATGLPVLTTGGLWGNGLAEGQAMKESLEEDFGIKVRWVEPRARDTSENAEYSAAILRGAGVRRIVLITHAGHLPRSIQAFARHGLEVVPAPMGHTGQEEIPWRRYAPSFTALWRSSIAFYELWGNVVQDVLDWREDWLPSGQSQTAT